MLSFVVPPKPDTGVRECAPERLTVLSPISPRKKTSPLKFPSAQPPGALSSTGRTCALNGNVDNQDDGDEVN
jgi:hypothetical protein